MPYGITNGMDVVTIDKFGRVVLPAPIRNALQLKGPGAFKAAVMGNKVELTLLPASKNAEIKKRKGLLVVKTGGRKFDAAEAVRVIRDERS
jgi:bifunctional DNA-binding transcriptional regulator/antitoxin component of YhaV-PrlF toxin-antitoxin module